MSIFSISSLSVFPNVFAFDASITTPHYTRLYRILRSLSHSRLRDTLLSWMQQKQVDLAEPDAAIDALWGAVHGLITLTMAGRIAGGEQRARHIVEQTVTDLLHAWQSNS